MTYLGLSIEDWTFISSLATVVTTVLAAIGLPYLVKVNNKLSIKAKASASVTNSPQFILGDKGLQEKLERIESDLKKEISQLKDTDDFREIFDIIYDTLEAHSDIIRYRGYIQERRLNKLSEEVEAISKKIA